MHSIVEIIVGSRLYGLSHSSSDMDVKAVIIPSGEKIIRQDIIGAIKDTTGYLGDDVEGEIIGVHQYLKWVALGQTHPIDMLFAPEEFYRMEALPVWYEIKANKDRLLTNNASVFFSYAKAQARKFAAKAERIGSLRSVLNIMETHIHNAKKSVNGNPIDDSGKPIRVKQVLDDVRVLIEAEKKRCREQHIKIVQRPACPGGPMLDFIEVADTLVCETHALIDARKIYNKQFNEYGERALKAEGKMATQGNTADWKAMSHAVRIGMQGLELLTTGEIKLPLTYAPYLFKIKMGEISFDEVNTHIEEMEARLRKAEAESSLPREADHQWINDFVHELYCIEARKYLETEYKPALFGFTS